MPAIAAAEAGLDIYGEKPFSRDIAEGRAICNAVYCYGRIWKTGSWQRSRKEFHHACELVRNGRLGTIERVGVGLGEAPGGGSLAVTEPPLELDYAFWLGPAPWCPHRRDSLHDHWRWVSDCANGKLTAGAKGLCYGWGRTGVVMR